MLSTRETVLPAAVEKCLGSTRAGTKKGVIELALLYAENEDIMGSEGVVSNISSGLSAKQPKLVAGSVAALTELVKAFGPKQVTPKLILKQLPPIFGHSDKNVRSEGALLAQELYRYLGAALKPTVESLKDIQAKELQAQFDEIDRSGTAKPVPTRHLLSQKLMMEMQASTSKLPGSSGSMNETTVDDRAGDDQGDFDPYEMAEAVDPLRAQGWPSNLEEQVRSPKWAERKEALEAARAILASSIKLQPSSGFDFFVDACAERIKKDATVHVWLSSCQCLEAAANGMREGFAKYKERILPLLLEKLKEKKQSTVEVVASTLDAIFQTVTFGEILEEVLTAIKHKNPNVKTESIRFLVRCLRTTKSAPAKTDIKPIAEALLAACSDGSGDVRDAGTQGLGTLMRLIGERPMNPYLDRLDDIKKGKVHEEFVKATVKAGMTGSGVGVPRAISTTALLGPSAGSVQKLSTAAIPKKAKIVAKPAVGSPRASPAHPTATSYQQPTRPATATAVRGVPAHLLSRGPAAAASSPSKGKAISTMKMVSTSKGTARGAPSASEPVKFRFSPEEAENRASDAVPCEIAVQLADSNWKERLAGMQSYNGWLSHEVETLESELVIRALSRKPGWKESNFQVTAEVFKAFRILADDCATFGRSSVALSIQPLCDKLGDIKLKSPAAETLNLYAEKTAFAFVLRQSLAPLKALKAPKAIADSLLWIDAALLDFGIQGVDVKSLVDHLLSCLKSANAAVRNNATTVTGTLARFLGSTLTNFLGDLNPQLRSSIEAEIQQAAQNPPPGPVRFSAELKASTTAADAGNTSVDEGTVIRSASAEEEALEALIPRVDIDKLIPASAISAIGDANWKVRKESLEEIQGILQSNTRLKGTLSELAPALKPRYSDSNIMCKSLALDIATRLANGLGKGFETQSRAFVGPVTQCLADAKAPVRQSAAATLSAMADAAGLGPMISSFAAVLETKVANPQLRGDLFAWLSSRFEQEATDKSCDLSLLALHAVQCLDDKLAAVKKAGLATLPFIIQRAGYKFVLSQADGMKPASKNTVIPLIEQARSVANALRTPPGAAEGGFKTASPAAAKAVSSQSAILASSKPARPEPSQVDRATSSPRSSLSTKATSSLRPPSAATRTLATVKRASSNTANTPSTSGNGRPGFGSRLGVARGVVMASSAASNREATHRSSTSDAPLLTSDSRHKSAREKKEVRAGQHWISAEGTPRPDLVDVLRSQTEPHVQGTTYEQMFSRDHNAERDFLSALATFSDFILSATSSEEEFGISQPEVIARIVANADLILKYVAIRLTDGNTSISLKCFDLLVHLVEALRGEQYHVSDYEANSILPCMIAKFGDAKVAFRDRIRDIFRRLTFIYPPSKLMTQFLECGLPSKNARTRAESLGEIGFLFSKYGLSVCTPSKTLPVVAKCISDRDTNVRTAALLALGECYKIVGDEVWSLIGRLPDKEMSLLEERLKRTVVSSRHPASTAASTTTSVRHSTATPREITSRSASAASSRGRLVPPQARTPRQSVLGVFGSQQGSPSGGFRLRAPAPSRQVTLATYLSDQAESSVAQKSQEELGDMAETEDETSPMIESRQGRGEIEQMITEVLSSEAERSTEALKSIHQELQADAAVFASSADQLASVLGKQYNRAFAKGTTNEPVTARLRKYLIQVSSSLFDSKMRSQENRTLASYIDRSSLNALMTQLLQRLIDTSNQAKDDEDAKMYATYLNKVVIRCFGSCNLNVLYSTSFTMLGDATEDLRELSGKTLETRFQFAELIVKCLWKVGRRLPTSLQEQVVEPSQLLNDVEAFLQRIQPNEWKARAREEVPLGDLPLRTVKVILSHLVSSYGEDVLTHLDRLESPENAESYKLLVRMINQTYGTEGYQQKEGGSDLSEDEAGPREAPSAPSTMISKAPEESASHGTPTDAEDPANAELKDIFERISQKEQSRKAIKDLYEFQKRFPHKQLHIERSLQNTGPIFQRYIKRALANHAAEDDSAQATATNHDVAPKTAPNGEVGAGVSSHLSSPRSSHLSLGKGIPTPSTPERRIRSGSHIRQSSNAEERLAQLRAKFYKTSASPRDSAASATLSGTTGVGGLADTSID